MENTTAERSLTLGDFWKVFKRAFLLMLLLAVLFTALHAAYSYLTYAPIYVSDGKINTMRKGALSTSGAASHPGNEVEYAIFVQTQCVELMKTRKVYDAVIDELGLGISSNALASIISIKPIENTSLVEVSVRAGTPESAQKILTSYMDNSIKLLSDPQYELLGTADAMGAIIDKASLPKAPANSRFSLFSAVLGIVAAVIVYAVYLVLYMMNDFVTDAREVTETSSLSLLGEIPDPRAKSARKSRHGKGV